MVEWFLANTKYLAVALGMLAGFPLVRRQCRRLELTNNAGAAALVCLVFSVFSVISALLFALLERLLDGEAASVGSISTYGVYFLCPILIVPMAKALHWDGRRLFDMYALYAVPSLLLMRVNCLFSGCCGGRSVGIGDWTYPTRTAEILFYAAMLIMLLRREKRGAAPGTAFPFLMASYGGFRFVTEWFRAGEGWLHLAHGWSAVAVIIGLGLYYELQKNNEQREHV